MKKLIENNIAKDYIAKTIRCIDNVHGEDLHKELVEATNKSSCIKI